MIKTLPSEFSKTFKAINNVSLNLSAKLEFFHIFENLYILQLPKDQVIEDFYDTTVTGSLIGTRTYNSSNNKFDLTKYYGKKELLEKIIFPNQNTINFSKFDLIFNTIFHIQIYHYIYCNLKLKTPSSR